MTWAPLLLDVLVNGRRLDSLDGANRVVGRCVRVVGLYCVHGSSGGGADIVGKRHRRGSFDFAFGVCTERHLLNKIAIFSNSYCPYVIISLLLVHFGFCDKFKVLGLEIHKAIKLEFENFIKENRALRYQLENKKREVVVRFNQGFGFNGGGGGGGKDDGATARVLGNLALAVGLIYLSFTGQLGWILDAIVSIWLLAVLVAIDGVGAFLWWARQDMVQDSVRLLLFFILLTS
ncbi:hypothetical protein ACE6H2_020171 [Prunus campanulata]